MSAPEGFDAAMPNCGECLSLFIIVLILLAMAPEDSIDLKTF